MLRKTFSKSLKLACKENTTLNDTLKKYRTLQGLIEDKKLELINARIGKYNEDFIAELLDLTSDYVAHNLTMNECLVLLAIYANNDSVREQLFNSGISYYDFGLHMILDYE